MKIFEKLLSKRKQKRYLSLFDFLILTAVFLTAVFLAFFFLRKSKYVTVVVKVTNKNVLYSWDNPPSWFSYYFKEGVAAKDGLGRKTAEIKKVYRYDTDPSHKALYLTLKLKANYSHGTGKLSYEGTPLIIGTPIKIDFQNILTEGLVTYIEGIEDDRVNKEMLVRVQVKDQEAFVARAINSGAEIKDSLGNNLITVLEKRVEPALKSIPDNWGNLVASRDPLKKDIYLTLRLKVREESNQINEHEYYLFDDVRVNIATIIPLHFKNVEVYSEVIEILEVN